jgi:hypothetical protein
VNYDEVIVETSVTISVHNLYTHLCWGILGFAKWCRFFLDKILVSGAEIALQAGERKIWGMVGFSTEDKLTPFAGVVNPSVFVHFCTCCHSSGQPLHFWDTSFCTLSSSNWHVCGCSFTLNSHFFLYDPRTVTPAKCGIGKGYGGRMRVDRGTQSFLHSKGVHSVVHFQQQSCNQWLLGYSNLS